MLLFSVHPQNGRCHITTASFTNPDTPTLFAMVLRKHLEGGRLMEVQQESLDRVACFTFEARNELGEWEKKRLMFELMGKHSNLILLDQEGIILAAIKPYGYSVSRYRQVLPRAAYLLPPPQHKLNPFLLDEEEWTEAMLAGDMEHTLAQVLAAKVEGLSAATAREIVYRTGLESDFPLESAGEYELHNVWESLRRLLTEADAPALCGREFYFSPLTHLGGEAEHYEDLSHLLDDCFRRREADEAFGSRRQSLVKVLAQKRDKLARKVAKQEDELAVANDGEIYRLRGELLSANLYRLQQGDSEVTLEDYYHDNQPITIPLDPALTPAANAGRCYKRFTKAKTARIAIEQQLAANREELAYLDALTFTAESCLEGAELAQIRREATAQGYLRERSTRKNEKDDAPLPPIQTVFQDYTILIGRNNRQNDKLTLKMAAKEDLWFHTKDIPGSHVIIRKQDGPIPDPVIERAAELAAFHSRARSADKVPVDYTEVRQVKKPNGARPGMVIYFEQTTLYVKPRGENDPGI